MYPAHLFDLFPPFPQDNRVFVAMSFDRLLERRWADVIKPGVEHAGLTAYRVDASKISDSIVTEIEKGIAKSRLVLAEVSTVGGMRNANVLYEVGLAYAVRQPQEVLLFRSDNDRLLFDLSTVRVNHYDPDREPEHARQVVVEAVGTAMKEVDLQRSVAVERAIGALDEVGVTLLKAANRPEGTPYPEPNHLDEVLSLFRLLEASLVRFEFHKPEKRPESDGFRGFGRYRATRLGEATLEEALERFVDNV